MDTLKPDHPRLLAHAEDFDRIRELVTTDPLAKRWYTALKQEAERLVDEPVAVYELRDGRRLLYVSREVLRRVKTLGLLHRIEPKRAYRERIWADVRAVSAFDHWNPAHFLDVAEMGLAVALAYDWLYDDWTEAQRETMRGAMVRHALEPALEAYDRRDWWTRTKINWNQVCNGALIAVALAIADEEPALSSRMIDRAVAALPISMKRYAPDGGYDEGPGYWGFGTVYNVLAIASLESALGQDFGLGDAPGFDVTGSFPVQATGPTTRAFNFGDGRPRTPKSPAMFFFAKRYDQPGYARFAARHNRGGVLDLLWYDPEIIVKRPKPLPLGRVFDSAGVGVLRSAWDDPRAWYVGLKGGAIDHGHAQMDLGSFILESQGVRWFIDLGPDDYNLPGYFESDRPRWRYYRNRAEGHNTLVVNPGQSGGQRRDADAKVALAEGALHADLTSAYPGEVGRTIGLDASAGLVRVADRFAFDRPSEVWWFAHTTASIALTADRRAADLVQEGKCLRARIVSPEGARFAVMDAGPLPGSPDPAGQNPNNGAVLLNPSPGAHFVVRGQTPRYGDADPSKTVRKLAIRLEGVTQGRIEVVFENVE
ncbi:MAG: heparinase II/III domain-containing protein [Phycisphaeraceae bacterium]